MSADVVDTLIACGIDGALDIHTWEEIEEAFRPSNQLELVLRWDFEGMSKRIEEGLSEGKIPEGYRRTLNKVVGAEKTYRALKQEYEWRQRGRFGNIRRIESTL